MPQQMRWPTKAKWSAAEAEKAAASVADLPISDSLVCTLQNKSQGRLFMLGTGLWGVVQEQNSVTPHRP